MSGDTGVSEDPQHESQGLKHRFDDASLHHVYFLAGSPHLLLYDTIEVYVCSSPLPLVSLWVHPPVQLLVPQLFDDGDVDGHLDKRGIKHLEPHDTTC